MGFALSCCIIPRIADKIGRRGLHHGSMLAQLVIYAAIIYSRDIKQMQVLYFLIGLSSGGRSGVGISYYSEFIPF
jgi:MFS family permease